MTLPATNATVTAVHGVGTSEDHGHEATAGAVVWSGGEGGYLVEKRDRTTGKDADQRLRRFLVVPYALGRLVDTDQTVTFSYEGNELTEQIRSVELHLIAGTCRLWLADG